MDIKLVVLAIFALILSGGNTSAICDNLAFGKSTGYYPSLHSVSGGTANGITDGKCIQGQQYSSNTCQSWTDCVHTSDWQTDPFVTVDLGESKTVRKVTINSGRCNKAWAANMKIMVSDNPLVTPEAFETATLCNTVPPSGLNGYDGFCCNEPITGRYVGYFIEGASKIVCFCETEVFESAACPVTAISPFSYEDCDACTEVNCDDSDQCTIDTCTVEDGNAVCGTEPKSCDDGDVCTDDSCDSTIGCINTPNVCDDGNACTEDSCDSNIGCVFTQISCEDNDICTLDSCDPVIGCEYNEKCAGYLQCDTSTGECQRDCSTFLIDDFLRDCSVEFDANEGDIETLKGDVVSINTQMDGTGGIIERLDAIDGVSGAIENINQRLGELDGQEVTVESSIDALSAEINNVKMEINDIKNILTGYSSARLEGSVSNIESISRKEPFMFSTESKDKLIAFLLVFNALMLIGFGCICIWWNKSKKYSKYENVKVYSSEYENESQHLRK